MGLRKLDVQISVLEINRTPGNPIILVRCTDLLSREYSDLGVSGCFSRNLNIV